MSDTNNSNINYASELEKAIRQGDIARCIVLANLVDMNLALNSGYFSIFLMQQYFAYFGGITLEIIRNFRILLGEIVRYADGRMSAGVRQGITDINRQQSFQLTAATRLYHNGTITREEAKLMYEKIIARDPINADIKYRAFEAMLDNRLLTYDQAITAAYATKSASINQNIFDDANQDLTEYDFYKIMLTPNALYNYLINAVNKDSRKQINKDKAYIFFNVLKEKYEIRLKEFKHARVDLGNMKNLLTILTFAIDDTKEVVGNEVADKWAVKGPLNELTKNIKKYNNIKSGALVYAKDIQKNKKKETDTKATLINIKNKNSNSATDTYNEGVNSNNNNSIANPNNSNYQIEKNIDFQSAVVLNNYNRKLNRDIIFGIKSFFDKKIVDFFRRLFHYNELFNKFKNHIVSSEDITEYINQNDEVNIQLDKRNRFWNAQNQSANPSDQVQTPLKPTLKSVGTGTGFENYDPTQKSTRTEFPDNNFTKATDDFNSTSIPIGIGPC